MRARIDNKKTNFFHAVTLDGDRDRVFVHQGECNFNVGECEAGDIVDIERVEEYRQGYRGRTVTWVRRPEDEFTTGTIVNLFPAYGFMKADDLDSNVMCHISSFGDYANSSSATFTALRVGDRVAAIVRETERGFRGEKIRRV